MIPRERLTYAHNLVKRLFSLGELFSKTESLCKKMGASNKGSAYFRNREGISNSFFFPTLQQQLARDIHLNLKEKSAVAEEIGNLLKKVAIEKVHMKKVSAKVSV